MPLEGFHQQTTYETMAESVPLIKRKILEWEQAHPNEKNIVIVAGPSASGKDTFVEQLGFNEGTTNVSLDRYYKNADQVVSTEGNTNFSNPEALDQERIARDLAAIIESPVGSKVKVPVYDMRQSKRISEEEIITERRVIVQGVYASMMVPTKTPFRIFIDASDAIRLGRKISRDTTERGIPEDLIRQRFEKNSKPVLDQYVLPQKESATILIKNH